MSSTSASITIDEWIAANTARIQKKKEAKRQKMIRKNLKLEKERKKEMENARRLAEDEARAVEELIPVLPRIGSRYPMIHTLTLTLWPAPAPVSEVPGPVAPRNRSRAPVSSTFRYRGSRAPASRTSSLPAPVTPIPAPPGSTIDSVAASAVEPPIAKSALKRQISAQKKLHIDMVLDEEPLPAKRARKAVNYFKK
ncbi:hypothetical protein CAEBREN_17286 [Caenorhabditis brenneri]|uniref:Uncharacterized protein n=1 Tax=Caenorhabditis brenneri TaxID=135651 RepID=G0PJZ4_CAEBE|nr:hypothetical protein CAEBREN_17286 [Caenorhabditis brenneri]